MTAIAKISLGALAGKPDAATPTAGVLPTSRAASNQITETFDYQSYFDTTLLHKAILDQPLGQPIVQSTKIQQQIGGYAIGNHPDSQAPVAITFSGEGRQSGSASHIIPPGAIVRPTSGIRNGEDGFQSFSWGLPFGWLGGGTATIVVFQTKDAWADWEQGHAEIIFHRFTAQILAPGSLPAAASINSWPRNWPLRFPALNLQRGATSINQGGAPQIAIARPGKLMFRLRTTIGADSRMKALLYHTTDFDDELAAVPSPVRLISVEFDVPARTPYAYPAGYVEDTGFFGPEELARLGCNGKAVSGVSGMLVAGVHFVSDDAQLQGQYLDIVRYGYL